MGKTKSLRRIRTRPWRDVLKSIKAVEVLYMKPVDHVALNIPLYPTIVKEPMAQTIRKLAANEYAELDDRHGRPTRF